MVLTIFPTNLLAPKNASKGIRRREREKEDRGREPFVRVRPPRRSVRREGGEMRVVVKERERQREGREWRDERGNGKREKGGGGGVENVANGKLCVV